MNESNFNGEYDMDWTTVPPTQIVKNIQRDSKDFETMSASKNDKRDNKPAMHFVHPDLGLGVGNAMRAGEMKYGDWNFLKGHGKLQLCSAILRHTYAIMKGEDIDADTTALLGKTVYHWDCVGANINMMIWQREYGTLKDDKPSPFKMVEEKLNEEEDLIVEGYNKSPTYTDSEGNIRLYPEYDFTKNPSYNDDNITATSSPYYRNAFGEIRTRPEAVNGLSK